MAADWNPDEGFQTEVAEPTAAPATPAWSPDEGFGTTPTPDTPSTPVLPKASASAGYGAISTPVEPAPPMDQPAETQVWSPNDGFDTETPVFESPVASQQGSDDGGGEETPVMQVNEQPDMGIMGWLGDRAQDIGNWVQDIGDGFNVAGRGIERIQQGDIGGGLAQVGGGLAEGIGTAIKPVNDAIMAPFIFAGRTLPQAYNAAKDLADDNVDPNSVQGQLLEGARNSGWLGATFGDLASAGANVGQTLGTQGFDAAAQQVGQAFQQAEGKGWGDYASLEDTPVSIPQNVPIVGGISTTIPLKTAANLSGEIAPYFAPVFGQVGAAGKGLSALGGAGKVAGAPLQVYGRVGQAALEAPNRLVTAVAGGPKIGAALTAGAFTTYLGATAVPKVEKTDEDGNTQVLWDPSRIMGSDPSGIVLPLVVALGGAALWRGGGGATIAFDKALGAATGNALRGRVLTQITSNEKPVYVRDNGPAIDMGQGAPVPVPLEVVGVNRAKLPQGVRIAEPGEVVAKYSNIAQDRPIAAATRSVQGVEQVMADLARVADNDPQTAGPILRDFLTNPDSTVLGGANTPDIQAARKLLNNTIDRYVDIERNTVLGAQDVRTDVINRLLLQNGGDSAQFGANLMQKTADQIVRQLGIKNADWQTSNIRRFTALTDQLFEDRTLAVRLGEELKRQGGNAAVLVKDSPEYRRLLGDFVDPNKAGANRGLTERRVGEVLQRVEKAWQDVQRSGREQGTVYRTPDALNPRLRGFGQNDFVDAMAMSKAIMSPYLLSGAPRYFINNLIGDSINMALSTHGRAFGTPTEAAMRRLMGNWGLSGLLDGQWASGGSVRNAMGQEIAPYRLPNQTGRVRALDQFAKDRAPGVMGVIDTVTLNRPLRAFGERVQDMAVLGEAYRRRMALTAEVLPVVERNFGLLVEQRARANGATPDQARQLARDVVQAVSTEGLGALKQPRFRLAGLDLDGIPREYQADIRRAWRDSRGDPVVFQQRVNTLLDDTLTTIRDAIDASPSTQARNLFGVIVDRTSYQAPGSSRVTNRAPGETAPQQTTGPTPFRNQMGDGGPSMTEGRVSDLTRARNDQWLFENRQQPTTSTRSNRLPTEPNAAQIPVRGVNNRLTGLVPDDVIQVTKQSRQQPYTAADRKALSDLLRRVREAEGIEQGHYSAHAAAVKQAAGEKLTKYELDILEGRTVPGTDAEPRRVYENIIAILQAESGLTKSGSTRKFYNLGDIESILRGGTPKRLGEAEAYLRGYLSFLDNYDVLRLPKGKAKTVPVVTVPKGSVTTPSDAAGLQAYLDAAQRAATDMRSTRLATAAQDVGPGRVSDITRARNDPDSTEMQARPRAGGDVIDQAVRPEGFQVRPAPVEPARVTSQLITESKKQLQSRLAQLRRERAEAIKAENAARNIDRGLGGLRPEAQRLYFIRQQISEIESRLRDLDVTPSKPIVRRYQDNGSGTQVGFIAADIRFGGQGDTAYVIATENYPRAKQPHWKVEINGEQFGGRMTQPEAIKHAQELLRSGEYRVTSSSPNPIRPAPTNQSRQLTGPDTQRPGVFRGTQAGPDPTNPIDLQPRTGSTALNLATQGMGEVVTRPGSKTVEVPPVAQPFRQQQPVPGPATTNTPKAAPASTDPRAALDDVMARTMPSHVKMATAFDELTRRVMAVPDDVRRAPDLPDRIREAMNDPIYGGDPKIKAVADAMEALDQRRSTYQQAVDNAMRDTGVNNGKVLDPQVTRRILDDIPDPVNPGWKNPDGSDYTGPAFMQGNQWLGRDGQPLTFTRSMAWGADPVPDVVARIGDLHEAIRGKLTTATSTITPTDARFLKPGELQDALRLAQQMASREGTSKARAMLFGYDDRSQGQYLLDHWSPYSYWTVSHMLRTAQYLAPNPQAFAGMAIAIRQVAEMNKDQAPWDRFSVALFTAPDGTTVRLNPAQFFPYATQGIASLVSPDDESLAKNLLDLFGLSAHVPINLAMQWVQSSDPNNPYVSWYTGTKPGEKRARSLTPQTELVRLLSGGVIDIEGGKVFGATIPSFRKAIYNADAPASNATAATLELARRVFAGELTELDARRAILSWKDGKPNDVYRDAETQGLRDKGIGALVRFLGAPVTIKSAEANRIDALYTQLEGIPKTDKKAAAALFDQNPDLSVYSSAGQNTTADKLRQSIAIDEQPTYTGGTPEQQARWTMANKIFGDAYGKAIDAGKSTSVAAQEARSALEQAGYDYNDFQLGNYYENPERKRLLAEAGGYEFTPSRARYSDQASVTPEELVKRDNAQGLYYQNRDTMNARSREARVIAQFGQALWQKVKDTALDSNGEKSFGNSNAPSNSRGTGTGGGSQTTGQGNGTRSTGRSSGTPTRQPRVDWDNDRTVGITLISGKPATVREFWAENQLLRERNQGNDMRRQLANNWEALIAAGVKLEGNKPTFRSDSQEAAWQERQAILEQYSRLRDRNAEAAAKFYRENADRINALKAASEGKAYQPSTIFFPRESGPRRSGGGSIRVPRQPFAPRTSTFRQPATFETDLETQSLRNYFKGLQGVPSLAYIKRIRAKWNLGLPATLTDEQWLEQAKTLFTAQQAA